MWDTYGICKDCGHYQITSFGNSYFWPEVCPGCGVVTGNHWSVRGGRWKMVTARKVKKGWFSYELEIKE